jgi:hypothetical protein
MRFTMDVEFDTLAELLAMLDEAGMLLERGAGEAELANGEYAVEE